MGLFNFIKNYREKCYLIKYASDNDPLFSLSGRKCWAKVVGCYDGDTCTIVIKLNNKRIKYKVRMEGYDTPEMRPPLSQENRDSEIDAAKMAKSRFLELIGGTNSIIWIECGNFDKYGRLLIYAYPTGKKTGPTINTIMVKEGHAYAYDGGTKLKFKKK